MISEPGVCCKVAGKEIVTSSHWRERSRATTGDLPPLTPRPVFNLMQSQTTPGFQRPLDAGFQKSLLTLSG